MALKKRGLGRGLGALLENSETDITSRNFGETDHIVGSIALLKVSEIVANPFQPRTTFEKEALLELSNSIKEHGIIQPVTVRKIGYDQYQLISGERRFRASQVAGLEQIPAYIRIANDQAMLEMALVENIQRKELDAIEVAISFKRLIDECNITQEELGKKVSKNRSTVTNFLRLLKLPSEIQVAIRENKISMGHARAILSLDSPKQQIKLLELIIKESLSVRSIEQLVKERHQKEKHKNNVANKKHKRIPLSFEQQKMTEDLSDILNEKIALIKDQEGKGKIVIPFASEQDLNRILSILNG